MITRARILVQKEATKLRTKDELRALMAPLRAEMDEVEKQESRARAESQEGKCYKYLNSYGGSKPRESWWIYGVVLPLADADNYWPNSMSFQNDKQGRWNIDVTLFSGLVGDGSYIEISRAEFEKAWATFTASLPSLPQAKGLMSATTSHAGIPATVSGCQPTPIQTDSPSSKDSGSKP